MRKNVTKYLLYVTFFLAILGLCRASANENSQFINVVNRAIKKDQAVFSNSYLADQFFHWHKKNPFKSFEIDTVFIRDAYREVWIIPRDPKSAENHYIAMLLEGDADLKIVEIRTLMSRDNRLINDKLAEVIDFIERFLWVYETGDEGFIYDFLYPDYIKLKYRETEDSGEILALLRKQYPYKLPVNAVELENRNVKYRIDLKLQLPLVPLQITVDIQKYLTARYFELKDKKTRFDTLKRSLNNQTDYSENHTAPVIADTPHQALNIFLETYLDEYNINILQRKDSFLICEANLLPIFDHLPVGIQYKLQATPFGNNSFFIAASWWPASVERYFEFSQEESSQLTDIPQIKSVLNGIIQRYAALGLPDVLKFTPESDKQLKGKMHLFGMNTDSIMWHSMEEYQRVLDIIARDKLSYFFPRIISGRETGFSVTGYQMCHSRLQLWYHLIKIKEIYVLRHDTPELAEVFLQLYPFIRSENILSFLEKSVN